MIVDGVRPCVSVEFVTSRSHSLARARGRVVLCCAVLCCLLNCRQCLSADRHLFYRTRPEFRHARPTLQNCYTVLLVRCSHCKVMHILFDPTCYLRTADGQSQGALILFLILYCLTKITYFPSTISPPKTETFLLV